MARLKAGETPRSTRVRARAGARFGIVALCALFSALVADPRSALAYAAVTPASGGTGLVVGTPAPLSGPYVAEAVPGGIGAGAITLQAPPGFEFDTSQYVTATVVNKGNCGPGGPANDATSAAQDQYASASPGSATSVENQPLLLDGGTSQTVAPTPHRIKITVTQPSSGECTASIEWSGIGIKATAEGSGSITKAPGGGVISGVTDGATDFGWLSATAPTQQNTVSPAELGGTTPTPEPTASAIPEERSAPPEPAPEEGTTPDETRQQRAIFSTEPQKTDGAESTAPKGTTGGSAAQEQVSRARVSISWGFGRLIRFGDQSVSATVEQSNWQNQTLNQTSENNKATATSTTSATVTNRNTGGVTNVRTSTIAEGLARLIPDDFTGLFSGFLSWKRASDDQYERRAGGDLPGHGDLGSATEGTATEARAAEKELSAMDPPADYQQVVDNASPDRFSAPGWQRGSEVGGLYYGEDYSYVEPSQGAAPANFKVKIPETGYYTVYAWWHSAEVNSAATRFGVSTTSGVEWVEVNQQTDGGMWVRLGAYEMEAGDGYAVQVAPDSGGEGLVIADAVMVVRGTQVTPPEGSAADAGVSAASMRIASGGRTADVVRVARKHIGTRYRLSPPHPCKAYKKEDCSCHTKVVFREAIGKRLPDDPAKQWKYGKRIRKSKLRPGDLVFFKEGRSRVITHVGIYSGGGNIVHASNYWGKVVERPMKYVDGFYGAKRLGPN